MLTLLIFGSEPEDMVEEEEEVEEEEGEEGTIRWDAESTVF